MTAHEYIVASADGSIVTSRLVQLACKRHLADLETGYQRNLAFDESKARHVIKFVQRFCKHSGARCDGKPVILETWQRAMLWILYGWRYADSGFRRFRIAYVEMAKGNGKSLLCSAIGIYELIGSGEPGAEVYAVATQKSQAKIVWDSADMMVRQSPELKARIKRMRNVLVVPDTTAKFEPVSSDEDSMDGKRPQCIVADELHRWGVRAGRDLWNLLINSLDKRDSPLLIAITTAGDDQQGLCYQQHLYSDKVLSGHHEDDRWFAWVCCLETGDNWEDETLWVKANPSLGVIMTPKDLQSAINKAQGDPTELNGTLRLRFGIWTSKADAWMDMDEWDKCSAHYTEEQLAGQPCYGGLDLATTNDIAAFVLAFPPRGERKEWAVLPYYFLPEDNIEMRVRKHRVPYDVWHRQGLFNLTGGNVIDYRAIRQKIRDVAEQFDVREIAFDRWNANETVTDLTASGFTMVPIGQGMQSMAAPTKRLMEMVLRREIALGKQEVLRWMASNVTPEIDAAGNAKPDKSTSREKIDGIVALIMAIARGMLAPPDKPRVWFTPFFA